MISLANLIRCLGLFLILQALATTPSVVLGFRDFAGELGNSVSIYLLPSIIYFGAGLAFAFKGASVAEFLARGESDPGPRSALETGIYLVGVWWLLQGGSDLIYHFLALQLEQSQQRTEFARSQTFPYFVATIFELAAAGILLIKGRRISLYLTNRKSADS